MATQTYLVALGSNRCSRWGTPAALLERVAATQAFMRSPIHSSCPLGPGRRRYANAVAVVETELMPPAFLACLKAIERAHGRRGSRRWGDRVLDLDVIGWSGGVWRSRTLTIPHPAFRERAFVLAPLVEIVPNWRDPVTRLTARQLLARWRRTKYSWSR